MEEKQNAFICSTRNYDILDGVPRYKLNTDNLIPVEYDYYGYSFIITKNYFDYTPIKNIHGINVQELFSKDENTLDILVPESYKKDEELITQIYQDFMYFNNVEVGNIYKEEFNQELITKQPSDFQINIIYVPNEVKYAVYNSKIEYDYINNCIAIVVNSQNYHRVQLQALSAQGLYVYSDDTDLEERILQVCKQNNYEAGYHSIEKISDKLTEYKKDLITERIIISILYVSLAIFAACCIFFIRKIYKKRCCKRNK